MRFIYSLLTLAVCTWYIYATPQVLQHLSVEDGHIHTEVQTLQHLSVEDGLSSNYVFCAVQDKKGFLWFATSSGLNRFDGRKFNVFTKNNSNLPDNDLNFILGDPFEDVVWIATQRNGLYRFDYATETIDSIPTKVDNKNITHLSKASNGGIWISHYDKGIEHYNQKDGSYSFYSSQNLEGFKNKNFTAVDDGEGNLYVGHNPGGLSAVSLNNMSVKHYVNNPSDPSTIPGNVVYTICVDKDKKVWVGTDMGLALFNPTTERFITFRHRYGDSNSLLSNEISDIKQMNDGTLWIGTNMGGVSILNLQENVFTSPENVVFQNLRVTNDHFGLSGPNVRSILQDSFGNVWMANYRGGIDFISHSQSYFNLLPYSEGKKNRQVWGIWFDNDRKQLWMSGEGEIGVYEKGVNVGKLPLSLNLLPLNTHANVIYQDSRKNFWFGTYKSGVLIYSDKDKTLKRVDEAQYGDLNVNCIYEDHDGKIWFCSPKGLFSFHVGRFVYEKNINEQLSGRRITGVVKDKEGKLWVGTFGKGVLIFDTDANLIETIVTDKGFATNAVNHMVEDSKSRIIVATTDGIILFDNIRQPEKYAVFGAEEGLQNTQVRAIREDLEGSIWISTNGGIAQFDESKRKFLNYNHYDGVPRGDFMNGSTAISDEGVIFFGSQSGVCYFNPRLLSSTRKTTPVTITQFTAVNKKAESIVVPVAQGEVKLPYNQSTFTVSFNVLDYSHSPYTEFTYMLEGVEDSWNNTLRENQVTFRNIPPGNYVFKIKSRISNQDWDNKITELKIRISPPFWKTWYAKTLYFLLLCLILFVILRFYKRKIDLESSLEIERREKQNEQELNKERLQFYTNITHELRTPLTLILGPLEDLLGDNTLSRKHADKINIIHLSATRLLNLISRILEFRKTETRNRQLSVSKENLVQLVQEIGLRYKELNTNSRVTYRIENKLENNELFFDTDVITIILDNLLSNAAKYTLEGEITLEIDSLQEGGVEYTEISVADTGFGIDAYELPLVFNCYYQTKADHQVVGSGIGLALAKDLAKLHEGSLHVVSTPDVGSKFTLRLETNNPYPDAIHVPVKKQKIRISNKLAKDDQSILLVVEDNVEIREYIANSFSEHFEVIVAENGRTGWELVQEYIPDVIISDIMMPVMDGIELCRLVKEDIRTSHIPFILLTAKDSVQDKEEGYTSGADSYVTKPFSAKLLHIRVNNLLEARKKIASLLAAADTHNKQESVANSLSRPDNEFLQKITDIVKENIEMERMDVAFIADKMCMSHSTLYRKIKGLTNGSVNELIRKVKLRYGANLLLSEQYTISEISFMTGFSSGAYFRQCFKDEFGMTPSKYIKQMKHYSAGVATFEDRQI